MSFKFYRRVFLMTGIFFLFFFGAPTNVNAEIDYGKCFDLQELQESGLCNDGLSPPIFDKIVFYEKCQEATGVFEANINKLIGYGSNPSGKECKIIYSFFKDFEFQNFKPATDLEFCMKELSACSQLFLACQGNTGGVAITDLQAQCTYFLSGSKKWAEMKGADICQEALQADGPIKNKCKEYDKQKIKAEYKTINKDAEKAAMAAEKQKVEAEVKGVFNKIGTTDPKILIGRIINGAMGVLGSLALAMFVYGGVLWMTAAGESARSEKARNVVVWSVLGIAIIFASYAIVNFVFEAFR